MRAKEAVVINKSLSTLGIVVMALAKGDATYVPYRDAKLTRLLQDSLGGNSYTMLLATVHPRPADAEESLNTLQFANRCRNVTTQPHINFLDADADSQAKIIDKLMKEIADLKQELSAQKTHYEGKLQSGKHADLGSSIETGATGMTLESGADAAGGEGGGAGEGKAGSRGTSRGSKRAATGERSRAATSATADAQSQALAEAQALSREMKDKFVKKNNEFRAAQEAARNNEARLKKEIDEYRNKVATVTETLNANTQKLQLQNEETVTRYDKEIDQLKDHNNKLLNDMDAALRSVPEKLRVDSDKLRTTEATIRANAEAKEKEMLAQLEKQTKDAARDLELQREQYEYWLTLKTEELKTLLAEFQTYKSEKVAQVNTLEKHCMHLFDYCNALATIMANFDKGLYPVYEKTGIKAVNFPDKAKPGPMAADTLRDLTKYKKRADDFIKSHPTNLTATFTESNPTARTGSGAANTEKEELQRLRQETETLRNALQAAEKQAAENMVDVRAQVEQQVLADLADHPTVEYIKRIEDERTYYKEQLHEEVRRCKDLRVALDSKQRVIDKTMTGSHSVQRFGSGMSGSRGMTGTSRFPALSSRPQS
eukprot:Tamp_03317.p1 GENE.Tamp_03317~~Tamp_03317.p1  ORF type:complete len:600 (+),score=234.07 Tamp_03317:1581-3380(+)